jgi:hypothetical protein
MARQQFKAEKRKKELARLRKNEEKRQKREERKRARQAPEGQEGEGPPASADLPEQYTNPIIPPEQGTGAAEPPADPASPA